MPIQYAYLIGTVGLSIVFILLCLLRTDLRRVMVYSGLSYLLYGFIMFLFIKLLARTPEKSITPGYWSPPSLFRLNNRTGGYGIEDAIFSFLFGAIAGGMFEVVFKLRVSKKVHKKFKRGHAILFAFLAGGLFIVLAPVNAIYFFIVLQALGAGAIVWQRRDLLWHSIAGGMLLMGLYAILFVIFNTLFPHFIGNYYHLQKTSHLFILKVPLEEYLYALTLGMMWAPLYEYEFRLKDNKLPKPKPRKVFQVAGAARR